MKKEVFKYPDVFYVKYENEIGGDREVICFGTNPQEIHKELVENYSEYAVEDGIEVCVYIFSGVKKVKSKIEIL